jgi:PH (Pleckstrin Homology) domain-containing protein
MRILDVDEAAPAAARELSRHLAADEQVLAGFVSPTGSILFTDRRILLAQREHLLEEKVETASYSYRGVRHFSIQEGESRSAIRIWLGGEDHPLHLRANPGTDFARLQHLLADRLA